MAHTCQFLAKYKAITSLFYTVLIASALLFCSNLWAQTQKSQQLNLSDKMWGTVLYEFYQENYQQGLVQLAIAEEKGLGKHKQQALVAKGGMSLFHGMDRQAEALFISLADAQEPRVQAQAWFWLSKSYFDSAQWSKAKQGLEKTTGLNDLYNPAERELLAYMQAQMLFVDTSQSFANNGFMSVLKQLPEQSVYRPYLLYNRGLMLLNQGQLQSAINDFSLAKKQIAGNNWKQSWFAQWSSDFWSDPVITMSQLERDGFNDRIHLAMGYTHLAANQPHSALTSFANIRRQQQDSANALLGYAQALVSEDEIPLALAIWQKISEDFPASTSAVQSLLAMAWQLEQAGDEQQAWDKLHISLGQLKQARQDVANTLLLLEQDDFLHSIANIDVANGENEQGSNWPQSQGDILQDLLSGHSREQMDSWLQLQQQQQQLVAKQNDLSGFRRLLDERKNTALRRSEKMAQADFVQQALGLENRLDSLSQVVEQAQTKQDASVFADDNQLAQLTRLKRAKERLQRIVQGRELSPEYQQRLTRIEGILTWHFADNYEPLLWQHKQALKHSKAELEKTKLSKNNLLARISFPPSYSVEYEKIAYLEGKVQTFLDTITQLKSGITTALTVKASQSLLTRVAHLKQFEQNIKLAMLRLQDKDPNQLSNINPQEVSNINPREVSNINPQEVSSDVQ